MNPHTSTGGAGAAPPRLRRAGAAAAILLVAALAAAACGGDNVFSGGGLVTDGRPLIVRFDAPVQVAAGQQVDLHLRALAPRGLARVTVQFRRAVVSDRELAGDLSTDTVQFNLSVQVPSPAADSILVIEARAVDQSGRVSEVVSRTVRVSSAVALVSDMHAPGTDSSPRRPGSRVAIRERLEDLHD